MKFTKYDADWIYGMNPDDSGRFVRVEQAAEALRRAVEALAAAGRRADAQELREAAQRLERVAHSASYDEDYGWSVAIDADPDGEYVRAREVARHLRAAAEQLDRAGHWARANELMRFVKQLGPGGE